MGLFGRHSGHVVQNGPGVAWPHVVGSLFAEKGALSPDCLLLWTVEIIFSPILSTAPGTSCLMHLHPWPVPTGHWH